MSEIRNALTGLVINNDMTEPSLRESYLRYKALQEKCGEVEVSKVLASILHDGITLSGDVNPLLHEMRRKLGAMVNYENDYRVAENFLNNIFLLQQRENIDVATFLPFIASAIKTQTIPRVVWRDVLHCSREVLKGNPICVVEFGAAFTRLCHPDDFNNGRIAFVSPQFNLYRTFNVANNDEAHHFAYKVFLVHEDLPIVKASNYAWLNNHRSTMVIERLKAICEEHKVTPKQMLDASITIARALAQEEEFKKLNSLCKLLDDSFGDIRLEIPRLKPDWFDDALLEFFNLATVWNNFKKKVA